MSEDNNQEGPGRGADQRADTEQPSAHDWLVVGRILATPAPPETPEERRARFKLIDGGNT